jgi:small-conductance mechanosensitive channel
MEQWNELLAYRFLDNTLADWGLAAAAFLVTFLVIPLVRSRLRARRERWLAMDKLPRLELLSLLVAKTSRLVLLVLALYLAGRILTLPAAVERAFNVVIIIGAWIQAGIWATTAVRFLIQRRAGAEPAAQTSIAIVMLGAQMLLWTVFVLLALDNLGINITALVAGLGVGGVAVALAVQTLLGDLFGSLSIALDKPFVVGDHLRIDDIEGTVEQIGLKSTRLRSVTGEQIILSNADVLRSRVRNLGRMRERRSMLRLLVAYDTPPEKIDEVPRLVEKVVRAQRGTRFLQCLLHTLGSYALEFEAIYYIENQPQYPPGQINDAINRGVFRALGTAGIRLALPTQQLVMNAPAPPGSAGG